MLTSMKGPPITVKCDCGRVHHVPYGDAWVCENCGKRWNTRQIPSEQYEGIMREQRRFRLQAMGVAVLIALTFLVLAITQGRRALGLLPIVFGVWFLWYMPMWRRRVRRSARNLPTWHLTPE